MMSLSLQTSINHKHLTITRLRQDMEEKTLQTHWKKKLLKNYFAQKQIIQ